MLGEVLSTSKATLEGRVTRQICSLRSPITPPPPSHHHTLPLTLGHINTVLVFEDHGPIGQSKDGTSLASVQPPSITTAHQNLSSVETLPTWSSHIVPQANTNMPQTVPGFSFQGQHTAPPQGQTFGQSVGQHQTVDPSGLGYLPPSSHQLPQPSHDTNVHLPVTGEIMV